MAAAYAPITEEMRQRARTLGVAWLDRLDAFGMDDRRESAFAIVLAGVAPLLGLLLLHWDPSSVLLALFLNLLMTLAEDVVKIRRSLERRAEMLRESVEDVYVWLVARSLAYGSDRVPAQYLPSEKSLQEGDSRYWIWFPAAFAFATAGFAMLMLLSDGSVYAHPTDFALATAPNLALALAMAAFHRWNHHPHWRRAGSVRLQTAAETGGIVSFFAFTLMLVLVMEKAPDEWTVAIAYCVATIVYGLWRAQRLLALRGIAYWLRTWIHGSDFLETARARRVARIGVKRSGVGPGVSTSSSRDPGG